MKLLVASYALLATTASAFQISPTRTSRHQSPQVNRSFIKSAPLQSSTSLNGKLWKRLQTEEDDPDVDGTSWYLINCVAGVELDLLAQARIVCERFPKKVVEKFVVPTTRHLRSHGDKKKVVDVRVRYPGYLFCKIALVEDVYETLQELDLCRSWMGTVNRKGHKKLPPSPIPLNDDEVKKFKGLEEAQEEFENEYGGDYSGRTDAGEDLMAQYAGYDVGQMVKVLSGNFEGEDGTVRRLKDGQLMVRMFTYGQTYDEWFMPDAIRPLSDLEVMRGLSGPTVPVDQEQFEVSIGKRAPPEENSRAGEASMRSGLLQGAGAGPDRNRRQDRVARGETGRDMFGRSADEIKKEEENWLAYREERRANQRGGPAESSPSFAVTEAKKKVAQGPKKGQDTWGIVERSSWDGGEAETYEERIKEEEERRRKRDELYKDRPEREPRGRRGDFGDRRSNDRDSRPERRSRDSRDSRNDDRFGRDTSSGAAPVSIDSNEADFFDSLMSELSDDLKEDNRSPSRNERQSRGSRQHDNAGPSARTTQSQKSDSAEDSFFANLMSELGGSIDEPRSSGGDSDLDDDDFFSNLEAELSQSLGDDFGDDDGKSESDDDDDFFASLQSEMGKALDEAPAKKSAPVDDDDDFFASLQSELGSALEESSDDSVEDVLGEDFFSGLIDEIADEVEASSRQEDAPPSSKQSSSSSEQTDFAKLTVPVLKDMLRDKGLKVGGKKSELIERLQQS
eukprot:scaffold3263_cov121-Skeletonema_dohrnii-CCMP3373.AAC.3